MYKNILFIALVAVIGLIVYLLFFNNPSLSANEVKIKGQAFHLEVAKTIPQKSYGLMNRTSLCQNCGMIFVFDFNMTQIFWMKDTLIPLDMVFIDSTGKVTNIETATPEPNTPDNQLKLYKSTAPAKYVIELNADTAKKIGLVAGDIIDLPSF